MSIITKIKIGADGAHLPDDATDHVAVLLPQFGLTFTARPVITDAPQADCVTACKSVDLFGDTWDIPTIEELSLIVDRTRSYPAIDTGLFLDIPDDWCWTNSPWINSEGKESSSSAWGVLFYYGHVDYNLRDYDGFALAVRRAGQ